MLLSDWRQIRSHGLCDRHSRHPGLSDFTRRAAAGYWGMIEWLELRIPIKVLKRNYLIYTNSFVQPS